MKLASVMDHYHDALQAKYGSRLLPSHLRAIQAISQCRKPQAGEIFVHCPPNAITPNGDRAPAAIAAAPNARIMRPPSGSIDSRQSFYLSSTSW